jgi:hypothetical protein
MSKLASTREAVTLACWPPGPEERLVRSSISASGTTTPSPIAKPGALSRSVISAASLIVAWRSDRVRADGE